MRFSTVFGLLAVTGSAIAQTQYHIQPDSVDEDLREKWCDDQKATCPLICTQLKGIQSTDTIANECDADTLEYSCICEDNTSPNLTEYSQTMPFHICQEWVIQCSKACGQDNTCTSNCQQDHPCGAQTPKRVNVTSSTSMSASPTETGKVDPNQPQSGWAGETTAPSKGDKKGAANSVYSFGQSYGFAVVFAGLLASFTLVL